jgi:hypothetical protein
VSAKDIFHDIVKEALQKEQWVITKDPFGFKFGNVNFQVDLGAEKLLAADRGDNRQMDKINQYREAVQNLLIRYAENDMPESDIETQLIFDRERDHYQWMDVGWQELNRIYRCAIHLDIKEGKIWLQQNLTDRNPAAELVEMGIPREDIVLGLHPPYKRPYTEYGVA